MLKTINEPRPLSNKWTHILCILLCLLGVNLGGCGVHFHNAANEAQARKANDSFKAADVGKYIEAERQVVQTTHERNLTAIRRHSSAERDRLIAIALTEKRTIGALKGKINSRQNEIGFPEDTVKQKNLSFLQDTLSNALVARDRYLVITASTNGISPPSFPPSDADEKAAKNIVDPEIRTIV